MKLHTGLHPGRWHVGAWILLAMILAAALLLTHGATGGAWAEPAPGTPDGSSDSPPKPDETPSDDANPAPSPSQFPSAQEGATYVSEVVDSLFFVSPAGFLALDLPRDPGGTRAIHLSGSVNVRGRNRDIIVRLFRSKEYDAWLHAGGTAKGEPLWTSKRGRAHRLDLALPEGGPFVLLLDNGYSIRTPKHVSCQLQIQYRYTGAAAATRSGSNRDTTGSSGESAYDESNPVTPRGDKDEEIPPPPPPPPSGY
jgi:hypothetical protein